MACPHHVSAPWNPPAERYARRAGGVRAATEEPREPGTRGGGAWPWFLDLFEAVPGFYAPCFNLAPALDSSLKLTKMDRYYR